MQMNRREFVVATGGVVAAGLGAGSARADGGPILIGQIPALTGSSSDPGIGFDRGVQFATAEINDAGGVNGRKIEIITRDTQGDPSKAVNAVQELINRQKVHAIWGPANSGESLAVTPIMAKAKMPNLHPCVIDTLIDPVKYPNAYRVATANAQWDGAAVRYVTEVLKLKSVAIVADTTGYGTTAAAASEASFKKAGVDVAHKALIDSAQPDISADMLRIKNSGAQVLVLWSVSTGLMSRIINGRGDLNWDVPIVGHPSLGSGQIAALLKKPEYWEKVYQVSFKNACYDASGKLPARSQAFFDRINGKIKLEDTNFWWVAAGYDAVHLIADAVRSTGSTDSDKIIGYLNSVEHYPGMYGTYHFSATEHNGFPNDEVVMSKANSFRNGTFALAPGYA